MIKNKILSEEYVVKFWFKNKSGFAEQGRRSFFYENKTQHKKAEKDCIKTLLNEGFKIDIINVTYQ
jgi:hypothetical protein